MASSLLPVPAPVTDSLLVARDLARRHPETSGWLFHQIGIEIKPGDRLALVGPTGSGKSLILRALALLDPIDRGEISWCGSPVVDGEVPAFRSQVLYLQQRSPVIEGTVEDNLKIPFSLQIRSDIAFPRQRAEELLDGLGRGSDFLTSHTANLSGGERQIVALMRALLVTPTLLLLDEPSAALDPQTSAALEQLVDSWHAEAPAARAFVWVSHDPEQAQRVAQRIIRLRQGRIEADR